MWIVQNWRSALQKFAIVNAIAALLLTSFAFAAPAPSHASEILDGDSYGETWLEATATEKQQYCRSAFSAFRSAPSSSYIISSNVQDISPEGFCTRLDQFYSFEVNLELPLSEAAAIAPLLFADVSMDFQVQK